MSSSSARAWWRTASSRACSAGADANWRITRHRRGGRGTPTTASGSPDSSAGSTPEELELDRSVLDDERVRFVRGDAGRPHRPRRAPRDDASSGTERRLRPARARDRLVRRPARGRRIRPRGMLRLPHARRRRAAAGLRRSAARAELGRPLTGMVIGGGLLGLEAAGALQGLDVACTVVQSSDRLMSAQLDLRGGNALRAAHRVARHPRQDRDRSPPASTRTAPGRSTGLEFRDGSYERTDVVVFTVGRASARRARPRRGARRAPARRRAHRRRAARPPTRASSRSARSRTSTACASGLVAPGYAMAEVAATRLLGGEASFPGYDLSTKLKLSGVDVASFGDAFADDPGRARRRLRRPGGRRLQEARALGRREDAARRHPRRRCLGLRLAASARRRRARRRPGGVPHARGRRRGADRRAARRGAGVLVQQRHRGDASATRSTKRAARTSRASRPARRRGRPAARA